MFKVVNEDREYLDKRVLQNFEVVFNDFLSLKFCLGILHLHGQEIESYHKTIISLLF